MVMKLLYFKQAHIPLHDTPLPSSPLLSIPVPFPLLYIKELIQAKRQTTSSNWKFLTYQHYGDVLWIFSPVQRRWCASMKTGQEKSNGFIQCQCWLIWMFSYCMKCGTIAGNDQAFPFFFFQSAKFHLNLKAMENQIRQDTRAHWPVDQGLHQIFSRVGVARESNIQHFRYIWARVKVGEFLDWWVSYLISSADREKIQKV